MTETEQRGSVRHWARTGTLAHLESTTPGGGAPVTLSVRDLSETDCALLGAPGSSLRVGQTVHLTVKQNGNAQNAAPAVVMRAWADGLAVRFDRNERLRNFFAERMAEKTRHSTSRASENPLWSLACAEMDALSSEIRQIKDCQVRLLLGTYTLAVALYALLAVMFEQNASEFLKVLVTLGPSICVLFSVPVSIRKASSLNRAESFLLLLKQQFAPGATFYPGYFGYEDALAKYHNGAHLGTGRDYASEGSLRAAKISRKVRVKSQSPLFTRLSAIVYCVIYASSVGFASFQLGWTPWSGGLIVVALGVLGRVIALGMQVRSGRYSELSFLYAWRLIFAETERFDPDKLA